MIFNSILSNRIMDIQSKVIATRFMLTLPLGAPYGISALPDYVFNYIYEVGAMEDLPWIKWVDDETGARIYRWRRSDNPAVVYELCKESPLFKGLTIDHLLSSLKYKRIGVDKFESLLLNYCIKWRR